MYIITKEIIDDNTNKIVKENYIQSITNNKIKFTSNIKSALTFDSYDKANHFIESTIRFIMLGRFNIIKIKNEV